MEKRWEAIKRLISIDSVEKRMCEELFYSLINEMSGEFMNKNILKKNIHVYSLLTLYVKNFFKHSPVFDFYSRTHLLNYARSSQIKSLMMHDAGGNLTGVF
ncbi:hypothetical protein BpHYR1_046963 [Brachionus plicatilis]|uniref:Uncharacterized protein n=1 Tax=Brachionus plicatilis TaxID=10195 RepID=A0A3M7SDX0_BRAPC|nr:hypothetical protein BpHYR1_046963 [Brachionus plicatilis]